MEQNSDGYFVNSDAKINLKQVFFKFSEDIKRSKSLIIQLIRKDLYSQFRQQFTGAIWLVVSPLVSVIGYIIMYSLGILKPGDTQYPYFIYVVIGVGLWSLLAITTTTITNSLTSQSELILRTNIPLIAIPLSNFGRILLSYFSHIISIIFLMLIFQINFGNLFFLYPIFSILAIFYGIAFGLFFSIWQVVSREVTSIIQILLQISFFATPALFSLTIPLNQLTSIIRYNPLSYLVLTPRSIMLDKIPVGLFGYFLSCLLAFSCLLISIIFFYKKNYVIAERL